ncbi:MAG: ABC transporter permease [Chitinophagales bacterium]|nr:ABC transporter permease [Bacteroidota bacterium]MCB9043496.1 ABC transporter permease [Chitinophagales bacterium]
MLKYILKRILIFLPTLLAISLLTFVISSNAPGDPVELMLTSQTSQGQAANILATEKAYLEKRQELGLDLPIFYFALSSSSYPDTLYKVPKRLHRNNLDRLIYDYGDWKYIEKYYQDTKAFELKAAGTERDSLNAQPLVNIISLVNDLYINHDDEKINFTLNKIGENLSEAPSLAYLQSDLTNIKQNYATVKSEATPWKRYVPTIHFYGLNNQYHRWFFGDKPWFGSGEGKSGGFIRGDFGISYKDQRPVASVIGDAIRWTMLISFLSILLTYIVSIPLGVNSAVHKGSMQDQIITTFLFILYSLPSFWIATLLIMFFGGGDYFDWFPPYGVHGDLPPDASWWVQFKDLAWHLTLPLICWTYGSFAYLSRQMRGGMLDVLGQDYIRTARAKGLPENKVIWKHALRNSLLPVITLFASVFPLMISGAIVLEIIFSIPGMGKMAFEALVARNYPIVFTVMMFSAILTLVGYLVADILYAVVDPRITFSSKK